MQMLVCTLFILLPAISGTDCTCKDDESVDCTELNSKIGICDTIHKAKIICKKYCNLCDIDDGNWSPWSSWAKCDVTCGKGSLLRSRTCDNPAPQNGGLDCAGKSMELKTCNMPLCPVHGGWTLWGHWEKCSATCGVGMRSRTRSCTNPPPQRFGDHCFGHSIADELCSNGTCPVDGSWTAWSHWGKCSVSCGVGLLTRLRSCTNPSTTNAGNQCTGQNIEVKLCYPGLCEGAWTAWQSWSKCVDGSDGDGI